MAEFFTTEVLFYGGIAAMAGTAALGIVLAVFFACAGKRIRHRLEQEYGKPQK